MRPEKIIEALIFISDSPLKPAQILEVFENEDFKKIKLNEEKLQKILDKLVEKFSSEDFPFELKAVGGGYQFYTKPVYFPYLRHAVLIKNKKKLSRATLETLSIIAYRQPVTRPEMEFIRGVNCDYAVQRLLEKKLIEISGRADSPGKPLLYKTSAFFMEYFGINNIADLPKLQEFTMDEGEYQEQFKVYLEDKDELEEQAEEVKDAQIKEVKEQAEGADAEAQLESEKTDEKVEETEDADSADGNTVAENAADAEAENIENVEKESETVEEEPVLETEVSETEEATAESEKE